MDELLDAFERGAIAATDFRHEDHVAVAWELSRRYEPAEALRRLRDGIWGIATRAGNAAAYHETITRAWFELVRQSDGPERSPFLFDRALLGGYYSRERLAAGRDEWLEPDLHPLTLPPPRQIR